MRKVFMAIVIVASMVFAWGDANAMSPFNGGGGGSQATAISTGVGIGIGVGIANVENRISQSMFMSNILKTSVTANPSQAQAISAPLTNTVAIQEAPNKRELPVFPTYQAPNFGDHRGPYERGVYGFMIPWAKQPTWTKADIDDYPKAGKVTTVPTKLQPTESFKLTGQLQPTEGYVFREILVEGAKGDNPISLWGQGADTALAQGATLVNPVMMKCTFATKGTGWNVGFGGGFSAIGGANADRDNVGGSVGGGTGYGEFYTTPTEKCDLYLEILAQKGAK